jgi:uncharacterized protein
MGRVIHFEIYAADTARAVKFYRDVFDWTISRWDGPVEYWLVGTGEGIGIDGAIVPRRGAEPPPGLPVNGAVVTIGVDEIDTAIAAVVKSGGSIFSEKVQIPKVGWLCYGHDTEGNVFSMMQRT